MLWFWYVAYILRRIFTHSHHTYREVFLRPSKDDNTSWNPYETNFSKFPSTLILQGTMDSVVGVSTVKATFEKLIRERHGKNCDDHLFSLGGRSSCV